MIANVSTVYMHKSRLILHQGHSFQETKNAAGASVYRFKIKPCLLLEEDCSTSESEFSRKNVISSLHAEVAIWNLQLITLFIVSDY